MLEIWKPVEGYEGKYEVSNLGRVKSLNYNHTNSPKILANKNHLSGYVTVTLSDNGMTKNKSIHILVAKAFIPNPDNLPCVNHIDGDKSHNYTDNLEWVSYSQNTRHAIAKGLRKDSNMRGVKGANNKNSKPVYQFSKSGELIKKWDCVSDAARYYSCSPCTITNCCAGRIKSCKGFIWKMSASCSETGMPSVEADSTDSD